MTNYDNKIYILFTDVTSETVDALVTAERTIDDYELFKIIDSRQSILNNRPILTTLIVRVTTMVYESIKEFMKKEIDDFSHSCYYNINDYETTCQILSTRKSKIAVNTNTFNRDNVFNSDELFDPPNNINTCGVIHKKYHTYIELLFLRYTGWSIGFKAALKIINDVVVHE